MSGFAVRVRSTAADRGEFEVHVGADCAYFRGHFDGRPVLPGVAQLELLEDLAGRVLGAPVWIREVERVRFRSAIVPEDRLRVDLRLDAERGRLRFSISRGGERATDGVARVAAVGHGGGA